MLLLWLLAYRLGLSRPPQRPIEMEAEAIQRSLGDEGAGAVTLPPRRGVPSRRAFSRRIGSAPHVENGWKLSRHKCHRAPISTPRAFASFESAR